VLEQRLEIADLPEDYTERELNFIATWGDGAENVNVPSAKVAKAYPAWLAASHASCTWADLADYLKHELWEFEAYRPRGKRERAEYSLDNALRACMKAHMNRREIGFKFDGILDELEMEFEDGTGMNGELEEAA